jgi:hypothetical protein
VIIAAAIFWASLRGYSLVSFTALSLILKALSGDQ